MANLKSLYAKLLQGISNYGDDAVRLTPYADDVIRSNILQNSYPITVESFDGLKDTIQKMVANNDNTVSLSQLEDMLPSNSNTFSKLPEFKPKGKNYYDYLDFPDNPTGDLRDVAPFDLKNRGNRMYGSDRYLGGLYDNLRKRGGSVINPDIDFKLGR